MIIPIIIGATGRVTRSLKENLEAVPGKHSIDSLQKTAILGTSHIIRKVLQCEASSLSGGEYRWFKRSTRKKRSVARDINNNNNNNNNIQCVSKQNPEENIWNKERNVTGGRRKLRNIQFHNLSCTSILVRMLGSRRAG